MFGAQKVVRWMLVLCTMGYDVDQVAFAIANVEMTRFGAVGGQFADALITFQPTGGFLDRCLLFGWACVESVIGNPQRPPIFPQHQSRVNKQSLTGRIVEPSQSFFAFAGGGVIEFAAVLNTQDPLIGTDALLYLFLVRLKDFFIVEILVTKQTVVGVTLVVVRAELVEAG